ncbi:hypothetical protein [Actinomadura atramentaria]|uniref:hypothetical protein n=1 Tax=Actinomadura atramentaria TaxID=1990 RepID=UPI00035F5474|nr:hypothetical protein [Actinomadura atramentaria]
MHWLLGHALAMSVETAGLLRDVRFDVGLGAVLVLAWLATVAGPYVRGERD